MPANAIQEAATNLLPLRQHTSEAVLEYNIRFRSAIARFESAVERAGPNRPPIVALNVSHYESTVKPFLQCLQYTEKSVLSLLKEAMDKTRRHEAAEISGNISALSRTPLLMPMSASSVSRRETVGRKDRSGTGTHARTHAPEKQVLGVNIPRVGNVWVTPPKTASSGNGKQVMRPVAVATLQARRKLLRLARVPDAELTPTQNRGARILRIRPSHLGVSSV